ncbi:hypothetical protein A7U43_13255 [Mycobacterium adipatum]|uniref:Uncharacterized protein n=1 Tax=Mycobacterium adipatum TaxID=1682113 RepID=A0A172UN31_9MYCO|nr:hypothetical protein [Mycobacterium adipatum]ANE80154.1 hypothetical protein A7U43_13255 [Mycobacterium adipatum]
MTAPTITPEAAQFHDLWCGDYCPTCNPAGEHADRCARQCSLTEPDAVTWGGGVRLLCEYVCDRCGHQWRRADLWTPENLGFVPQRSAA